MCSCEGLSSQSCVKCHMAVTTLVWPIRAGMVSLPFVHKKTRNKTKHSHVEFHIFRLPNGLLDAQKLTVGGQFFLSSLLMNKLVIS